MKSYGNFWEKILNLISSVVFGLVSYKWALFDLCVWTWVEMLHPEVNGSCINLMPSCGKLKLAEFYTLSFLYAKKDDRYLPRHEVRIWIYLHIQMWFQLADLYFIFMLKSHLPQWTPLSSRWQYLRSGKRAWLRRHRDDVHGQHALPRRGGKVGFVVLRTQVLQLGSSVGFFFLAGEKNTTSSGIVWREMKCFFLKRMKELEVFEVSFW